MVTDGSLKVLRARVVKARMIRDRRLETKTLKRELFELENPKRVSFKKGIVSGARALGRGAAVTAKGIQTFAVQRQKVQKLREVGRKMAVPAIRRAVRTKQAAFRSVPALGARPQKIRKVVKARVKRVRKARKAAADDFGFDSPLGDFGF